MAEYERFIIEKGRGRGSATRTQGKTKHANMRACSARKIMQHIVPTGRAAVGERGGSAVFFLKALRRTPSRRVNM